MVIVVGMVVVVVAVKVVVRSEGRGGNDDNAVTQGAQGKRRDGMRSGGRVRERREREKGRKEEREREGDRSVRGGKVREKEKEGRIKRLGRR